MVTVLALAVALAQDAVVGRLRRVLPWVNRLSGVLLVVAGAYVVWYGVYEIRVAGGGDPNDPVIEAATTVQGQLAQLVDRVGPAGLALATAAVLVLAVAVRQAARRRTPPATVSPAPARSPASTG